MCIEPSISHRMDTQTPYQNEDLNIVQESVMEDPNNTLLEQVCI